MLTDKAIQKLVVEAKKSKAAKQKPDNTDKRGTGRLIVRAQPTGSVRFSFRYKHNSKWAFIDVGAYDNKGQAGLSLSQARQKVVEMIAARQHAADGDLKDHFRLEDEGKKKHLAQIIENKRLEEKRNQDATFKKLLEAYVDHLKKQNKVSWKDVKNLFNRNVFVAWPDLSQKLAAQVTPKDLTDVLRTMISNGVGRNTAKLRSYMRAAYSFAMQSANDPTITASAHIFEITHNPAASIPALSQFNQSRDRTLDSSELGYFINRVDQLPSLITRSLILIALHLGGQRPTQLARVKKDHLNLLSKTVVLFDGKGKRSAGPRRHMLPLSESVIELFLPLLRFDNKDNHIFTSNGEDLIRAETVSGAIKKISDEMVEAGEALTSFQMRDVRRTCETMFAAMGISSDVRAQLQSHGLGGVQNRHYDKHLYMDEKRSVLEAWEKKLTELRHLSISL